MRATVSIYINKLKPNKQGLCPTSVKVQYNRQRKYYPTNINFLPISFNSPSTRQEREDMEFIKELAAKAQIVVKELGDLFTFSLFEASYLKNRALKGTIERAFDDYIESLLSTDVGNKNMYKRAKVSILKYDPKCTFATVDVAWLKKYELWMLKTEKNSVSTVGMYLRCLRRLFNVAKIQKEAYPFGRDKYVIPTATANKRALDIEDIKAIMTFETENETTRRCRDLWIFIYFSNGLNVADLCRLLNKNLSGDEITFMRKKTQSTQRKEVKVTVPLNEVSTALLHKYRNADRDHESYLFPFLCKVPENDEEAIVKEISNVVWLINKHMKIVAESVGIRKDVTTIYARHSFATILSKSGVALEMISAMLGHSSIKTTEIYLSGFTSEEKKKATSVLMPK